MDNFAPTVNYSGFGFKPSGIPSNLLGYTDSEKEKACQRMLYGNAIPGGRLPPGMSAQQKLNLLLNSIR